MYNRLQNEEIIEGRSVSLLVSIAWDGHGGLCTILLHFISGIRTKEPFDLFHITHLLTPSCFICAGK